MNAKIRLPQFFTMLSLVLLALLSACSQATPAANVTGSTENYNLPAATQPAFYEDSMGEEPGSIPGGNPMPTPAPSALSPAGGDASHLAYTSARMVIKDAQMEILVQDTDQSLAQVTQLAADQGGYIISSQTWFTDGYKYASVHMGVPVSSFEATLNIMRQMGLQVLQETASGQDVSTEFRDLQSRLANLQATSARVREFLDQSQTVEDSLRINQSLSELEGQIETIKGQMTFYERRAAFSTITLSLTPQLPTPTPTTMPTPTPTPTPTPGWNPGETVSQAGSALTVLGRVLVDIFIWLSVVGGPFVLLGLLVLWILRRLRRLWQSA